MVAATERAKSFIDSSSLASMAQSFRFGIESLHFHALPIILPDSSSLVIVRSNWPNSPGIWYVGKNVFKEMPPIIFPNMGRCSNIIVGKGKNNILFGHLSDNTLDYGDGGIKRVVEEIGNVLGENARLDLYRLNYPFGEKNEAKFIKELQRCLGEKFKIGRHNILSLTQDQGKTIDVAYAGGRLARVFNYHPGRSTDVSKEIGKLVSISSDG